MRRKSSSILTRCFIYSTLKCATENVKEYEQKAGGVDSRVLEDMSLPKVTEMADPVEDQSG